MLKFLKVTFKDIIYFYVEVYEFKTKNCKCTYKKKKLKNFKGLFGSCFQELFSVLENKKHKKLVWGRGCVFVFCVFRVLKKVVFENNKKMFSLFFRCSKNRLFFVFSLLSFCVFLAVFYVFTKVSSTQLPHPHPQALSSSLNY